MHKWIISALVFVILLSTLSVAFASNLYFVASTEPNGYCYMYDHPSSSGKISRNLGRYDNGSLIDVLDWNIDKNYAYVSACDGQTGYIRKNCLSQVIIDGEYEYYEVYSTNPYGYCYLYDHPSSSGSISKNLGRYDNGSIVMLLDWLEGEKFAEVYTSYNETGYMRKDCLRYYEGCVIPSDNGSYLVGNTPKGYCYMYDHASSSGSISKNLGRYKDGSVIEVLDWYSDKKYAYVRGADGQVGYINKDYLIPN